MDSLKPINIDLKSLDNGAYTATDQLDDKFFKATGSDEIRGGEIKVSISAHKSVEDLYEIRFTCRGYVVVACDLCLDDMEQPIDTEGKLFARLGEENSEDDETVTVAKEHAFIDISWFVYETVALDIPIKHEHAPGKCDPAMIKALEEHSAARSGEEEKEAATDPRWSELEKLKSTIKD